MQTPNRYYNSPWIADAARNLSMAIYGDPEAEAARERQQFEMDRARAQDQRTESDRLARQTGMQAFSNALRSLPENPSYEDLGGLASIYGQIPGADVGDVMGLLASRDPRVMARLEEQGRQIASLDERQSKQIASAEKTSAAEIEAATLRAIIAARASKYGADKQLEAATDRAGRTNPIEVTGSEALDNEMLLDQIVTSIYGPGTQLDPATRARVMARSDELLPTLRNAGQAHRKALLEELGEKPVVTKAEDNWFFDDVPRSVRPDPNRKVPPAPAMVPSSNNLSSALSLPLAPTSNPLAAQAPLPLGALPPPQFGPREGAPVPQQLTSRLPVISSPAEARVKLRPGDPFKTPDGRTMVWK